MSATDHQPNIVQNWCEVVFATNTAVVKCSSACTTGSDRPKLRARYKAGRERSPGNDDCTIKVENYPNRTSVFGESLAQRKLVSLALRENDLAGLAPEVSAQTYPSERNRWKILNSQLDSCVF